MDEIQQFKKEHNGDYIKYSPKELIGGLHAKFDNQAKTIIDLQKDMVAMKINTKWLKRLETLPFGGIHEKKKLQLR